MGCNSPVSLVQLLHFSWSEKHFFAILRDLGLLILGQVNYVVVWRRCVGHHIFIHENQWVHDHQFPDLIEFTLSHSGILDVLGGYIGDVLETHLLSFSDLCLSLVVEFLQLDADAKVVVQKEFGVSAEFIYNFEIVFMKWVLVFSGALADGVFQLEESLLLLLLFDIYIEYKFLHLHKQKEEIFCYSQE